MRIIEQALDGLPEGPYITDNRKYALPPRHELATSMEALIHHFKLVTEGFRVPPGEVYYPIESPRGEMGCFVRSDGSSKPARVHMRDPSFVNLQAMKPMAQGPLHRRLHRHARDARPGAGRDRPLTMAIDPSRVRRFAHGSRVPGWDDAADLTKPPAVVPDAADHARAGRAARRDRGLHGALPGLPLRRDPGAARRPAAARLVLADRDRAGRVRDAPHARLPDRGGDVLRHVRDPAQGPPRRLRVHEHLLLAARRRRAVRGDAVGGRRRPRLPRASRSSAWARATSRR